jgi:hypothetical protein
VAAQWARGRVLLARRDELRAFPLATPALAGKFWKELLIHTDPTTPHFTATSLQ